MRHYFSFQNCLSLLLSFTLCLQLTGCATGSHHRRYAQRNDAAPTYKIDVSKIHDAVPKEEPMSRYGNPANYAVLGKRYHLLKTAMGYREKGIASWYGTKFHNHRTSSGEIYDVAGMTAAHKTLPIPCYARVTNLKNGRHVIVKINDRGPFHENRIIDLSYVAAKKLGIFPIGTGLVEVATIDPRHPEETPMTAKLSKIPGTPLLYLQLGAFAQRQNAERVLRAIAHCTQDQIRIVEGSLNGCPVYRVRLGPLANVETSDSLHDMLIRMKLGRPMTVIE